MAFKLGDVIIDRLQFGYGAKKNGAPLYALTQLNNANIDITADTTDINDKDGNLVYRKYSGKKGEVTAQNAFINLAIIIGDRSAINGKIRSCVVVQKPKVLTCFVFHTSPLFTIYS